MSKETKEAKKVLVIYYSLTGTTRSIAEEIQKRVGGDMFEIETVKDYPAAYSEIIEEAERESETGELPALKQCPPTAPSVSIAHP